MYHNTPQATINTWSADYRIAQRPTPLPTSVRVKLLRRYLAEMDGFQWTNGYKDAQRELSELEAAV